MSEIPDDIKQAAEQALDKLLCNCSESCGGTDVLVGHFRGGSSQWDGIVKVDAWNLKYKTGFGKFNEFYWPPTHWMPLPSPPKGGE